MKAEHGFDLPRRLQIEFSKTIQAHHRGHAAPRSAPAEMWDAFQREYLPEAPAHRAAQPRADDSATAEVARDHGPARGRRRAPHGHRRGQRARSPRSSHALRGRARRRRSTSSTTPSTPSARAPTPRPSPTSRRSAPTGRRPLGRRHRPQHHHRVAAGRGVRDPAAAAGLTWPDGTVSATARPPGPARARPSRPPCGRWGAVTVRRPGRAERAGRRPGLAADAGAGASGRTPSPASSPPVTRPPSWPRPRWSSGVGRSRRRRLPGRLPGQGHQLGHLPRARRPVLRAHGRRALLQSMPRPPKPTATVPPGAEPPSRRTRGGAWTMKVTVDYDVCASTGACMQVCPGGLRGPQRRLPLRSPGGAGRGAAVRRAGGGRAAARPGPSRSRADRRSAPRLCDGASRTPRGWTEMMPSVRRSRSMSWEGTAVVVARTITADPGVGVRPTSMSAMLTPASPSSVPTMPITPGRSSLRTTSMWSAGGTSTAWSSIITMRCSPRRPPSVPAIVVAAAAERDQVDVVGRRCRADLADLDAVLLGQLRRVDVGDRLVADAAEQALQHGEREDAGVVVGDLALVADLDASPARPRPASANSRPSRSASGRNGRTVSFASAALTLTANGTNSPARASSHHARRWCRRPCPAPRGCWRRGAA